MDEDQEKNPMLPAVSENEPAVQTLAAVYQEYATMVFRAAYRVTGHAGDAEDVLQTVFLRLAHPPLPEVEHWGGYLRRAAVNAALDVLRSRERTAGVPLDEGVTASAAGVDDWEARRQLRRVLARLTGTAAEMFALRYFEERSNPEIARLLGTSEGTVAVTLHRTREKLRRELREFFSGR